MIVSLLQSSILAAINDRRSGALETPYPAPATVLYEDISDNVFDIVDVKGTGGSIKRVPATGSATYFNGNGPRRHELRFIRYEEYLNQFNTPQGDWAKGMSRPDFIVHTLDSQDYFIIHELSEGAIGSKRHKAVIQILNTVRFLSKIPDVKDYLDSFRERLCYVSAKGCVGIESPQGMADGFMAIYDKLPDPLPINNQSLERMGFSAYASNVVKLY